MPILNCLRKGIFVLFTILILNPGLANTQNIDAFAEFGTTVFTGDHVPMWQVSLQHGFSSLQSNGYLRGGVFYKDTINNWKLDAGLDIGAGIGFETAVMVQHAYVDARYRWLGIWAGCKELESAMLNQELTSGGLTWSGNARPIPQVSVGIFDYTPIAKRVQIKGEISYGWFTDGRLQRRMVELPHSYTNKVKYHHKSLFFRFGNPKNRWSFELGITMDDQFGGYQIKQDEIIDLGNSPKEYINALIPRNGGEGVYFAGNYLGSEHFKLSYRHDSFTLSAYLENYFDDLSGMGKQNGLDGLWGIEFKTENRQAIKGIVFEYFQSTHQSGPMHGVDFTVVEKTGGADDYYNHYAYSGWSHGGWSNGTPLIASPIYNDDGYLGFYFNRVKAVHLGWKGDIAKEWSYRAKLSFNRTWGTPFIPSAEILENFSTFVEFKYLPNRWKGWSVVASGAFDIGGIYGDNLGFQLKIRKRFW